MKKAFSFYRDAFRISIQSIFEHKLRAFLTLIGIIIGVAAVVVVGASISGLNSYVTDKIAKVLGANHFMIVRMANNGQVSEEEWEKMNRRNKKITWDEYEYVKENCAACSEIAAQVQNSTDVTQDGIEMPSVRVMGNTSNMREVEDKNISEGRYFADEEVKRSAKVAVIGFDLKEKFFPDKNAIGETIKVRGIPLQVIGIEEKRGSMFGDSLDRNLYMPITLHRQLFGGGDGGVQLHGKTANRESFKTALEEARLDLRNRRKLIGSDEDNFGLVDVEGVNNQVDQMTGMIAAVIVPITMITLIVGGIVVMNIMLVSVTERTFEVGLRKALGATRKQILLQFLIESSLLCIVGGILGLLLAAGVTQLITIILEIRMTITIFYIVISVAVSTIIGVVAGLYPAFKAAQLDPIVALTKN